MHHIASISAYHLITGTVIVQRKLATTCMSHQLMCWDIVLEGRARRKEFEEDLATIYTMAADGRWQLQLPFSIDNYLIWQNKTIVITDPSQVILFASKNMVEMNGYLPQEVTGLSPRIFQGAATTEEEKAPVREGIRAGKPFETIITNYRKDQGLYKCRIAGFPLFNDQQELVNFIALENTYNERTTGK
jgi:PAS domain-containing protein